LHTALFSLLRIIPVTLRGAIFALASAYLLVSAVAVHSDIVAAVLGTTCLAAVTLSLIGSTLQRLQLKKSLQWQVLSTEAAPGSLGHPSDTPITITIKTPRLFLLPFFTLSVRLLFNEDQLKGARHRLSTSLSRKSMALNERIQFPHRGIWHPTKLELSLGDQFGFIAYHWNIDVSHSVSAIEIAPPVNPASAFPFISAASKPGDSLPDLHHQQGDYYDFRTYQEGDGLNKVLWKLYARSGELYTRQPERSITPEGTVAMFTLASRQSDRSASAALGYIRQLSGNEIEVLFGCEGALTYEPARTEQSASELLITSVWNIPQPCPASAESAIRFLAKINQLMPGSHFHSMIFIGHEDELVLSGALDYYTRCGESVERLGVSPLFFIERTLQYGTNSSVRNQAGTWPSRLLTHYDGSLGSNKVAPEQFAKICELRGWQLISSGTGDLYTLQPIESFSSANISNAL
jgi:uncharacterized protein (DUF58 family)